MKFFAIIALGLAAVVTAAPAPQLDCTRDGFFCDPCVNGKQKCVACADGTGLGLVRDCKTMVKGNFLTEGFESLEYRSLHSCQLLKTRGTLVKTQDRTPGKWIVKN
ncbi:hypothetical protein MRS44_015681 [Fusarium solani]|uniref:uncharacterized protein n=1 Tax=Fusarium solani TaxID=169388 RepID=UPI0032C40D32|nr:hypothetical protein MRS44_015681 [Fusarium solani]